MTEEGAKGPSRQGLSWHGSSAGPAVVADSSSCQDSGPSPPHRHGDFPTPLALPLPRQDRTRPPLNSGVDIPARSPAGIIDCGTSVCLRCRLPQGSGVGTEGAGPDVWERLEKSPKVAAIGEHGGVRIAAQLWMTTTLGATEGTGQMCADSHGRKALGLRAGRTRGRAT